MRPYYDQYESLRRQQLRWGLAEDKRFILAFLQLPRLSRISNEVQIDHQPEEHPLFRNLRREILVGPHEWKQLFDDRLEHAYGVGDIGLAADEEDGGSIELDGVIAGRFTPDPDYLEDETPYNGSSATCDKPIYMRHLKCLMQAIFFRFRQEPPWNMTQLDIANTGQQAFFRHIMPEGMPDALQSIPVMQGFEHLRKLSLTINYQLCDEEGLLEWPSRQLAAETRAMLAGAANLDELALNFEHHFAEITIKREPPDVRDEDDVLKENDFLRLITPPPNLAKLRTLSISGCKTSEASMWIWLEHFKASLRQLRIVKSRLLNDGSWRSMLRDMPGQFKLEKVYFERLEDGTTDDEQAVDSQPNVTLYVGTSLFEVGMYNPEKPMRYTKRFTQAIEDYFVRRRGELPNIDWRGFYRGLGYRTHHFDISRWEDNTTEASMPQASEDQRRKMKEKMDVRNILGPTTEGEGSTEG